MSLPLQYWLVVPAAGSGSRFGGDIPKQHLPLACSTVLEQALQPFLADPRCRGVVLALSVGSPWWAPLAARLPATVRIVAGGAERVDSVLAGLAGLGDAVADDWVLVHDAVRPCLAPADLDLLLRAGSDAPDGALLATPLADTLKRAAVEGVKVAASSMATVAATVPRTGLWRALTPQMFRHGPLGTALRAARVAGRTPTDEAEAIEWQGGAPRLVAARHNNIKITTADDLPLAAAILATRTAVTTTGESR